LTVGAFSYSIFDVSGVSSDQIFNNIKVFRWQLWVR